VIRSIVPEEIIASQVSRSGSSRCQVPAVVKRTVAGPRSRFASILQLEGDDHSRNCDRQLHRGSADNPPRCRLSCHLPSFRAHYLESQPRIHRLLTLNGSQKPAPKSRAATFR
jgi:hypothetical protein